MPSALSHAPATRNSSALVAACATSCVAPPAVAETPAASTTNPSCADVDAARSCFRSSWATATAPSSTAVATPAQATTGPAHAVACSNGAVRSSR